MSPQQEVFMACRKIAVDILGINNVYDYIPGAKAQYPFFFIGEQMSVDVRNKSIVYTRVTQTIHYFSDDYKKRGTISEHILKFMGNIRKVKTKNYNLDVQNVSYRMINDNSTNTPLLHAIVEVKFITI